MIWQSKKLNSRLVPFTKSKQTRAITFAFKLPFYNPPITSMAMDYTQLSEAAVDLLAFLNRKEEVSDIYFPFKLIEQES